MRRNCRGEGGGGEIQNPEILKFSPDDASVLTRGSNFLGYSEIGKEKSSSTYFFP